MKVAFIVKGLIKKKEYVFSEIRKFFPEEEIFETAHAGHAVDLARICVAENYSHIIAVGGDGTLSEVVNGMLLQEREKLPFLGLLTCGTANDFSKTVRLHGKESESISRLKNLIEKNSIKKIDIGNIRFTGKSGEPGERYFINIADIGIGGYIVEKINKSHKIFGPDATFFIETLKAMFAYRRTRVKCVFKESSGGADFRWEGKTLSLVVANGKYFGSGLCIAPDAELSDGKLNMVVLGDVTIMDYLKNLGKVKRGEKIIHPEVFYRETEQVEIIPMESKCPVDLDGEFIGYAPATFEILPGKINFLTE